MCNTDSGGLVQFLALPQRAIMILGKRFNLPFLLVPASFSPSQLVHLYKPCSLWGRNVWLCACTGTGKWGFASGYVWYLLL